MADKKMLTHLRESLVEEIPDAVIGLDLQGKIIDFNRIALTFFNISEEELLSSAISQLIPSGEGLPASSRFETLALKHGTGEFPVEVTSLFLQQGKIRYLIFRNITLRQKIAKELQLFTESIENSLNAFDIVNSSGKFIYVNKAYVKMWGYNSASEILGTSAAAHCANPETPEIIITTLKETGECNIQFEGIKKDGSIFHVLMWARLAHDADGNEIYPTTSIDITDRVLAANEKSRLQQELELAVKARDEFISICSHELKTPIQSLKLQFQMTEKQLLQKNPNVLSEEQTAKRVNMVNRQLDRMSLLIDDMMDVSKISSGRLHLNKVKLDLYELVNDVLERIKDQFVARNVPVQLNGEAQKVYLICDRFRIEQVIQNLLTNALKYGNEKPVSITVDAKGNQAILQVSDSGIGIARENFKKIFDRYERAMGSEEISGLGLGLYISKQIVELHQGTIKVDSKTGEGSTFTVTIPCPQN